MGKKYLPFLLYMNIFFAWSQEAKQSPQIVRTEPNGVVVYEAPGVEQAQPQHVFYPVAREQRTLEDLSVSDLEERLNDIDLKLKMEKENDNDAEQVKLYEIQRKLTLNRIQTLKNPE